MEEFVIKGFGNIEILSETDERINRRDNRFGHKIFYLDKLTGKVYSGLCLWSADNQEYTIHGSEYIKTVNEE